MARAMLPKLQASIVQGTGKVTFPADFRMLEPVLRADLIGDWIVDLQKEMGRALTDAAAKDAR